MSIKLKIKLPRAQNGMSNNEPCPKNHIKVDGECVSDVSRTYTVYETGVPGEYTTKKSSVSQPALLPTFVVPDFQTGPDENYINPLISSYYSKLPTKEAKKEFKDLWNKYKPAEDAYEVNMHGSGKNFPSPFELDRQQKFIAEFEKYISQDDALKTDANGVNVARNNLEKEVSNYYDYTRKEIDRRKAGTDYIPWNREEGRPIEDTDMMAYPGESNINYWARQAENSMGYDYTNDYGNIIGTPLNIIKNIAFAPTYGASGVAKSIQDGSDNTKRRYADKAAFYDLSGMSNYPFALEALENTKTAGKNFINNPSWGNAGRFGTSLFPTAFNLVGSLPLVGAPEKSTMKAVTEVPKFFEGTKGFVSTVTSPRTYLPVSREQRGLLPFKDLSNVEKSQVIIQAPFRAAKNVVAPPIKVALSTLGPIADATMLPYTAARSAATKAGVKLTEGPLLGDAITNSSKILQYPKNFLNFFGHGLPWTRGEHFYKDNFNTTPADQFFSRVAPEDNIQETKQMPTKSYPVAPEQGEYIPSVYQQPYITKDTTINFVSPTGKTYSINTGSPYYKEILDFKVSRDKSNWDDKTQAFKIDPNTFIDGDGNPIDIDEAMQELTLPQQAFGGMPEIPGLFRYQPDSALPKGQVGTQVTATTPSMSFDIKRKPAVQCPEGQEYDPKTNQCVAKNYSTMTKVPALQTSSMTGSGFDWSTPTGVSDMGMPQEGPTNSSFVPTYDILDPQGNRTQSNNNNFYLDSNNKTLYQTDPKQTKDIDLFGMKGKKKKDFKDFTDNMVDFGETLRAGMNLTSFVQDTFFTNPQNQKDWDKKFRERKYTAGLKPPGIGARGYYDINTGTLLDQDTGFKTQNFGQFGGMMLNNSDMDKKKIRIKVIKDTEEMAYGGQRGFGLDLGQKGTYASMPKTKSEEVGRTIQEVPREEANIEAEKGETVYADVDNDGMYEHMNIEGERHTNGGTPLNVPEGSFIFSDTAKMRIKDGTILKNFGLSERKGGYTPAEIAKKYDINKYKAIVQDPTSDYRQKNTAQIMIKNYQRKLAELALIQEEMKGFPQGIPKIAMENLPEELLTQVQESIESQQEGSIDPEVEQNMPEEVESEEEGIAYEDMEEQEPTEEELISMYGGDMFEYGGMLDPFQGGGGTPKNKWQEKIDRIKALNKKTTFSQRYGTGDTDIAAMQTQNTTGAYGEMTAADVEDFKKRHAWYFKYHPTWDFKNKDNVRDFQTQYNIRAREKGMDFDFFDSNSTDMDKLDGLFGEYTYNAPDLSDEEVVTEDPVTGYKCTGRDPKTNEPNIQPSSYPNKAAMLAAGAAISPDEAKKQCPPNDTIIPPGKIGEKPPPTDVPFKYMTPDLWKAAGIAGTRINKYLPFIPDTPFESNQFIPEDWRGKASQLQSLARQTGDQIGTYKGGPQSAADLSNIYAQQANALTGVISDVDARNIAGVNAFNTTEQGRRDNASLLRSANQVERWKGNVVANQNYDNAFNLRNAALTDQMANAWNNRMQLGLTNATNKFYYTDPRSGKTIFKGGYSAEDINGTTASNDWDAVGADYQRAQKAVPGMTIDQYNTMRKNQAAQQTSKYGGATKKKQSNLSDIARMLEGGYGFPF
jgi:hypothetical protein